MFIIKNLTQYSLYLFEGISNEHNDKLIGDTIFFDTHSSKKKKKKKNLEEDPHEL